MLEQSLKQIIPYQKKDVIYQTFSFINKINPSKLERHNPKQYFSI